MIGKAQAAKQPSIDELLASIRQAIHERVAPAVEDRSPSLVHVTKPSQAADALATLASVPLAHSSRAADSEAAAIPMSSTILTTGSGGFAGLLGGDVRLEEALARLKQTGWRQGSETLAAGETANKTAPPADVAPAMPSLRPSIDGWTDVLASPRPAAPERLATSAASPVADAGWRQRDSPTPPILSATNQSLAASVWEGELPMEEPMYVEHSGAPRSPERPERTSASQKPAEAELLSSEAASAASSAFTRLADAVVSRSSGGERSFHDITNEMLRPLLKSWLDDNLPGLVERLVREEIDRVAGRGK